MCHSNGDLDDRRCSFLRVSFPHSVGRASLPFENIQSGGREKKIFQQFHSYKTQMSSEKLLFSRHQLSFWLHQWARRAGTTFTQRNRYPWLHLCFVMKCIFQILYLFPPQHCKSLSQSKAIPTQISPVICSLHLKPLPSNTPLSETLEHEISAKQQVLRQHFNTALNKTKPFEMQPAHHYCQQRNRNTEWGGSCSSIISYSKCF